MTAIPSQLLGADGVIQRVRLGAYAWCVADGSVLLSRIGPGEPDAGSWMLPGGGVDFGEDPADAVLREVDEETGLSVRVHELAGIRSEVLDPGVTISGHRIHSLQIVYRASAVGGTLRPEPDGSSDLAAWIALDDLSSLPLVDLVRWARGVVGS